MNKGILSASIIVLLTFAIGLYFYPQMPDQMASHWNASGEVDGYMSKFWGLFLVPIISLGLLILFIYIPKIDPLKDNIKSFRKYYDLFLVLMMLFMLYIYIITILWNLGTMVNISKSVFLAIGILFYYLGVLMEKAKRNWFIGIRTPWTLSSDRVWNKTHKLGAKLFKISGAIAIVGVLFDGDGLWYFIAPVLVSVLFLYIYSYFEYKKEK